MGHRTVDAIERGHCLSQSLTARLPRQINPHASRYHRLRMANGEASVSPVIDRLPINLVDSVHQRVEFAICSRRACRANNPIGTGRPNIRTALNLPR